MSSMESISEILSNLWNAWNKTYFREDKVDKLSRLLLISENVILSNVNTQNKPKGHRSLVVSYGDGNL